MALPMNSAPKYQLILPSTGEEYYYKPFVVKQEKALMLAMQSEDQNTIMATLQDVIRDCFEGKLNAEDLATFDVEYIFAQLRGKSVGEMVSLTMKCQQPSCADDEKARVNIELNIAEVPVVYPEGHTNKIHLFEDVGVVMKYPSLTTIKHIEKMGNRQDPEAMMKVITDCMDYIYNTDEVFKISETSPEEVRQFVDNLTNEQFSKLQKFFETMPKMSKTIEYNCPVCGHHNVTVLEGLQSFFM